MVVFKVHLEDLDPKEEEEIRVLLDQVASQVHLVYLVLLVRRVILVLLDHLDSLDHKEE